MARVAVFAEPGLRRKLRGGARLSYEFPARADVRSLSKTLEKKHYAGALVELKLTVALPDLQIRCGYRAPLSAAGRQFMQAVRGHR